ncbi:MAG: CoA-binding protein [Saprospiraceae bacterium]|nr:CoA-binding protein [Saprospiraceae bacterium]
MKKTLILGATPNPDRYAYMATSKLKAYGHEVLPVGIKKGEIEGIRIENTPPQYEGVDTITLYLNPENQKPYYDYIFSLKPKRIIFNPGTENFDLIRLAKERGIETELGCTLVMLSIGTY